jgi:hypothetical protein
MKRLALMLLPVVALSCAQVLGYEEYRARAGDAEPGGDGAGADTEDVADAPAGPARPPIRPAGAIKASGSGRTLWFAIKRMYIGSLTSLGVASDDAWREWGFDIDGVCTSLEDSKTNIGTCLRHPEAKQDFLVDGDLCRDNNFGHHVVSLLKISSEGFESRINEGILEGSTTWLIRIDDVDDSADDTFAPAKLYRAQGQKGAGFKWDGTDVRKVLSDSVVGGDLNKPFADFTKGYIRDHVWVSGEPERRKLVLPVSGSLFVPLSLEAGVFTLHLDPDHRGGKRGAVAGAIPVTAIEELLYPIADDGGICPGTTLYESLLKRVQAMPDVVVGAPNLQDTSKQCDGISIGLGFDVATIQPVTELVPPPPPQAGKCGGDAGVDAK